MPSSPEQKRKKRDRQNRVVELLEVGFSIKQACDEGGVTPNTYYLWRKKEPWFANAVDIRRNREHDPDSFVTFRQMYFGFSTPYHQQQIVDVIESAQPQSINMILIPPGSGKTTVLSDWFNFILAKEPNRRIAVVSETEALGKKILRNVANRMTDETLYPKYIDEFGPFKAPDRETSKPWNAHFITHVQADSGERDYSMEILGAGSSIYGASFDEIILDDVQSLKTLAKTEGLLEWFRQVLYSRVIRANTTGRLFIIGTRCGPGDFYEELLKDDIVTDLIKIPALDERGNSYFPVRDVNGTELGFTTETLKRIESVVGPEAWSRQYMQQPVSTKTQTFTQAMIERARDETRTVNHFVSPGTYRLASLDPALSGHSVFQVAGYDYDKLYLLDDRNEAGLARYEDMWDIMEELTIKWHPQIWVIEGNNIQGGIARSDQVIHMAEKYGFVVLPHQTGRNKMDDIIGVRAMAGSFLRGEINIPWGDANSQATFKTLCDELMAWRYDIPTKLLRQDEVMAFWFIWLHWHRMRNQLASHINRNVNIGGLPWKPAGYKPKVSA